MANNAASLQLPIMVRKPKMVWPGLDKAGRHLKSIAGDGKLATRQLQPLRQLINTSAGNCLFASLSDQLYGTPTRHVEIRSTVIDHMRTFQPLYEEFVQINDIVQRRATRATTESVRKGGEANSFEDYLVAMSRIGAYGGQAELLAFVRAYDQDVMVHLPPSASWNLTTMTYTNDQRDSEAEVKAPLHICYGGDEERNAHYDSSQKSENEKSGHSLPTRVKARRQSDIEHSGVSSKDNLSPRAVRNLKSDPSRDMMHELVTRGGKELRSSLDMLNDQRARSPSITSSYSTGSKRSFEDDGDQPRMSKLSNKRRNLRGRAALNYLSVPGPTQLTSSGPPTPTSSQDTDSSSDQAEQTTDKPLGSSASSPHVISISSSDESDSQPISNRPRKIKALPKRKGSANLSNNGGHIAPVITMEPPVSTLQT